MYIAYYPPLPPFLPNSPLPSSSIPNSPDPISECSRSPHLDLRLPLLFPTPSSPVSHTPYPNPKYPPSLSLPHPDHLLTPTLFPQTTFHPTPIHPLIPQPIPLNTPVPLHTPSSSHPAPQIPSPPPPGGRVSDEDWFGGLP